MKGTNYHKPRISFSNLAESFEAKKGNNNLKNGVPKKAALTVSLGRYQVMYIDFKGKREEKVLDRHHLRQVFKIAARDLRILEPGLATSFPAAVLCREKALLVNLEELKVIIANQEAYVFNYDTPRANAMVAQLTKRLQGGSQGARRRSSIAPTSAESLADHVSNSSGDSFDASDDLLVPFEVKVLDVIFENFCSYLDSLWLSLESAALPAMDSLTKKVSSPALERVRRVKNHMTHLTSKVEDFKDVLQHYLDDDKDMFDLLVSKKLLGGPGSSSKLTPISQYEGTPLDRRQSEAFAYDDDGEFQECEMLFESYFILVDNLFDKLSDLSEYIDDTEDLINIELDHHRNQLIQLELVLTTATFSIALVGVVSGIFGMNIRNESESSYDTFVLVTLLSCFGSVLIFIAIMLFCKYKGLMLFSWKD